jgi:release factor glutamine methyltransferase
MEAELIAGRPLQYVLGYAWFMGKRYKVNEQVLIPRPETEELVAWIIDDAGSVNTQLNILDIGTGSGCIPIALKQALYAAAVTSCDISKGALAVAKENAANMNAGMEFIQTDFLDDTQWQLLGMYDVIVSNPPYIPIAEKDGLHANVRAYEPATALFVADDALVFYRAIASFGKQHLNSSGSIYCELHRDYAVATKALFEEQGYAVELRKDMHGNWRMLKAVFA